MVFELSDALKSAIVKAIENQEKKFLVDASTGTLVEKNAHIDSDEGRYYEIPEWDSSDGFALMEEFVNELHSPLAYSELQAVLYSGKGVFRGFKDVLKSYPLVERRWHYFKTRRLLMYVQSWYNSLREAWGLEKLDSQPEELSDLLKEDFVFREYNSEQDKNSVLQCMDCAAKDYGKEWPVEVVDAVNSIWRKQFEYDEQEGFVSTTLSGEFAGAIVFSPCPKEAKKAVLLTGLFVEKEYRGLGIAKELFSMALISLAAADVQWVFIANTFVPDSIQGMLSRSGFKKIGSGYAADLFANF